MIKEYKINNLFGFRNVDIKFEDITKILIGENGVGKTTILNSLFYLLTCKFNKLNALDFQDISITFNDDTTYSFTKEEIKIYALSQVKIGMNNNKLIELFKTIDIEGLIESVNKGAIPIDKLSNEVMHRLASTKRTPYSTNSIGKLIYSYVKEPVLLKFLKFIFLLHERNFSVLYFPTYRRVEEDLKNLGRLKRNLTSQSYFSDSPQQYIDFDDQEHKYILENDTLIHFGMEDVEMRIKNFENIISKSTMNGFSRVTGELLSELLKGVSEISDEEFESIDVKTVKIVLHRVGDSLSEFDRKNILNLLEKKEKLKDKKELVSFIFKLIEIYNMHKDKDDAIKKFVSVCNNYLVDKEYRYDESLVNINILNKLIPDTLHPEDKSQNNIVPLKKLSSGEKQIVSLFSKLYLEPEKNLIVLFDEPELSLSLKWQRLLLPDILASEKCSFLLAVTHSPFIFDNELEDLAVGINIYLS